GGGRGAGPHAPRRDPRPRAALPARHTAALALGQAEQSLPELTALCDGHPLDEPLQALRLRALRDAGRAAEALDAYEDVRRLLADRLGADPGPELRSLHAELLSLGDLPVPASAPREPGESVGNLRARLTSFIGRESDIETIRGDLAAARLVTLLGPGGAGKTRLSQEAAEAVRATMPGGVWLAELAPVDDPDAVPEAVLTAVGARETVLYGANAEGIRAAVAERLDDPVERLAEHCSRPRMLLILDNCEHVADAAARLTEELLARCPDLAVLATSREPLGVPGELLRPVEPLPEPVALRLLADRGAAARPGFRIDDDPAACAEKDERDVLRRLSVFAGGCDLPAAEAVCGPAALEALGSLVDRSLVVAAPPGGSAGGEMRYRLLETVAEYAGERLDESGQRADAERAHLTYFRELARVTDPLLRGPGQLAAIHRLEREYENLRTALRHAVALRDEQEALCLALSLVWYWQMRDLRIEARNWCREVMALGPDPFAEPVRPATAVWERCTDAPPPMTGEVLAEARRGIHLAHLACMDTELDAWQNPRSQEKLRAIARTYEPGLPQNCRLPGLLWFFAVMLTGDMDRLRVIIDASIRTCRQAPDFDWELASGLQMRANFLANRTDWAGDAARDADESLEIYRRLGDAWGTAEALSARAEAHERRGDYALAAADYEAAIGHAEHLGARAQAAVLSARLGSALLEAGEGERGERLLREVIAQHEESHSEAMPAARLFLAGWLGMTGRVAEAREQLRRLRQDFRIAHFIVFDTFILATEAWLDAVEGRYEDCLERIRKGIERATDPLSEAIAPHMRSGYLVIGAWALAASEDGRRAADAARCLGAFDTLLPPGHVSQLQERETREQAERHTRALLGDRAYETAYAEGGGLSIEEATALL
uniref:ATP-binding protein n=1 Tax=Streptomyces sp. NRRL S-146 TaxID=1463884 RepID=UPI0004C6CA34